MENYTISNDEFNRIDYPHSQLIMQVLREQFHLNVFQNIQLPVINAALLGHNCLAIMPTGGLKSLCYQLPALLSNGITVVITPLKSIIYNQLRKLKLLNIGAIDFSGDNQFDQNVIQSQLMELRIKIIYITPDKAMYSQIIINIFEELLKNNLISRFVIDEAHCVSQSHSFRVRVPIDSTLTRLFENVQVMAFTATATPSVRLDIIQQIKLEKLKYFVFSINRPNLKYSVITGFGRLYCVVNFIQYQPYNDSGIVFCHTQQQCNDVAKHLMLEGINASAYHAGMYDSDREKIQNNWHDGTIQVLCATFALGKGVDKPNVRFVLHYSMPKTIENYYQETGRAGHDGKLAQCVLYYDGEDYNTYIYYGTNEEDLLHINNYCKNTLDCRRSQLLNYFGEDFNSNYCLQNLVSACDNCLQKYANTLKNSGSSKIPDNNKEYEHVG